ncbi:hypothetical protein F0562_010807 [Nyssa sinensis]|uniref:Uncharacterized protein n=1 Tax=Nyssa sinensis TaxID=561372 RepID=A0A5J5A3L3_9ASTE|nr:hypothetical protein F0562_010807 [Nyssa sinensis]
MTLADPKVFMEAMLSEMRRVMRVELEQVREWIDQMESAHEGQPQNVPNLRRRERVQPREVRVEDEEPYGAGFDDEDDRDSVVALGAIASLQEKSILDGGLSQSVFEAPSLSSEDNRRERCQGFEDRVVWTWSGYSGSWRAGFDFQLSRVHLGGVVLAVRVELDDLLAE